MSANPFLGVLLHAIGGLAAASFYIPYKRVKGWAWENYWLAGGIFSWVVAPIALALLIVPATPEVLMAAPARALGFTFLFGVLWGVGGLTFGLSMRYLGIALGYAIALGLCAAFGTLIPPLVSGELISTARETSGQIMLGGVGLCLLGIAFSGVAGISKERELPEDQKTEAISEFSFAKGLTVAIFSGIMSASMAYAFQAGKPISEAALAAGAPELWQNLPVLIIAFLGGLTTNAVWCLILMVRNGTMGDYTRAVVDGERVPLLATSSAPWRGSLGTSSSSSTAWGPPRWAGMTSPVGQSTWPPSSLSAPSGASPFGSGAAPADAPMPGSPSGWPC